MKPVQITKDLYLIGDSDITDSRDCSVYLLDLGELVLIDAGAGPSAHALIQNIKGFGLDPSKISTVILTHCHIDHVGGAREFKERFGAHIVMHELDATAVENADNKMTAADWYGINLKPLPIDVRLTKDEERVTISGQEIVFLHTPGHSPGSISVYLDRDGKRILFGQDIHGPFLADFGANMKHWRKSMEKLLALKADVLCEGHFGVYTSKEKVTEYIERYLEEYGD